jgi:hypothetical protein
LPIPGLRERGGGKLPEDKTEYTLLETYKNDVEVKQNLQIV